MICWDWSAGRNLLRFLFSPSVSHRTCSKLLQHAKGNSGQHSLIHTTNKQCPQVFLNCKVASPTDRPSVGIDLLGQLHTNTQPDQGRQDSGLAKTKESNFDRGDGLTNAGKVMSWRMTLTVRRLRHRGLCGRHRRTTFPANSTTCCCSGEPGGRVDCSTDTDPLTHWLTGVGARRCYRI